jgi:murein DD-endopeptidase MepM/ murein hydrolase activator NlpD
MREVLLHRPEGGLFPDGAQFLSWSKWWGSHFNDAREWVKGQVMLNGVMMGQHTGVDILTPIGTELLAPCAGKVTHAGHYPEHAGYGNFVSIEMAGPKEYTVVNVCHLAVVSVSAGDFVQVGDRLGLSGATGNVQGPHVHIDAWAPWPAPIRWIMEDAC